MRVVAVLVLLAATAYADPGDAELAEGKLLATQRRYKEAIVQFKAARVAAPARPEPDCLVALAYRRLERWAQARLFLERCTQASTHPDYYAQLVREISAGLQHAGLTEVRFTVNPSDARVSLASFADDEIVGAREIYLEPGRELVTVQAPGFPPQQRAIDVPASGPYDVLIDLTKPPPTPSRASTYVFVASGGAIAIGIVAHVLAASTRTDLTTSAKTYDAEAGTFKTERGIAIGAYAVGAVGVAVGAWLWHRERIVPIVEARAVGVAWSVTW